MYRFIIVTILCLLPFITQAETLNQTLNEIGQRLKSLVVDIQRLSSEADRLSLEAKKAREEKSEALNESSLDRIQTIGNELQSMTAKVEKLEFQLNKLTTSSANQFDDINFRLCELEKDCDINQLESSTFFGSDLKIVIPKSEVVDDSKNELAVAEAADYATAETAFENKQFDEALIKFKSFIDAYPQGNLTRKSYYFIAKSLFSLERWDKAAEGYSIFIDFNPNSELLGDAYFEQGQAFAFLERWTDAARSYLGAFSHDRDSAIAPNALYYLGLSLDKIGQRQEACQTVNEVVVRYPEAQIISMAINQMQIMECR